MSEDLREPRAEGERSIMLRRDAPSRGQWRCLALRTSRDPPGCPPPAGPRLAPPCRFAALWRHTQARGGDQRRGERTRGATRQAALRGLPQAARSRAAVAERRATWARGGGAAGVLDPTVGTREILFFTWESYKRGCGETGTILLGRRHADRGSMPRGQKTARPVQRDDATRAL
jgi:hypothetical protein